MGLILAAVRRHRRSLSTGLPVLHSLHCPEPTHRLGSPRMSWPENRRWAQRREQCTVMAARGLRRVPVQVRAAERARTG